MLKLHFRIRSFLFIKSEMHSLNRLEHVATYSKQSRQRRATKRAKNGPQF